MVAWTNLATATYFKFTAKKGQRVHCVAKTRELGSACDLYMSLHKVDGSQIAVARQDRQTILVADIGEDGDYVLQVEDLLVGGSSGHVYRIDLSDCYGGFTLHAEQTQYTSPQGGTFVGKGARATARLQRAHRAVRRRPGRQQ